MFTEIRSALAEGALVPYIGPGVLELTCLLYTSPKKDLEEPVVAQEKPGIWGGWIRLANGWQLQMPEMAPETSLPITVEARKLAEAD